MAKNETNSSQCLGHQMLRLARGKRRLGLANKSHREGGKEERYRIEQNRDWRGDELHQNPCKPRSSDFGDSSAQSEFAVPLQDLITLDERWQVRLIGDVKEDGQHASRRRH